jgi:uncharacterized membrane-anchored protein
MKYGIFIISLMLFFAQNVASQEQQLTAEQEQYLIKAREIWNSLDRQQGKVVLPNGVAELNVPDNYYYLNPTDSEKILVQVWGNPPDADNEALGMILPSDVTPFGEDSWGVIIQYEEDGYVSDENANEIDYEALLLQMKEETSESSRLRVQQGYETIELVGWASKPYYNQESHKLHWAKEFKFGGDKINTLNYNIRILGRKGVLVLNFIASMDQKQHIDLQLDTVLAMAKFSQGFRYEDFDSSIDEVAAYGIGALVAGKAIASTGFFAAALVFLKKFAAFIVIGVVALLAKVFRRSKA